MSTSYALLLGLVIFLILFIYFVFFTVSLRLEKNENEAELPLKESSSISVERFGGLKNKKLGWIDLGNHMLVVGIILFAIFIITNA